MFRICTEYKSFVLENSIVAFALLLHKQLTYHLNCIWQTFWYVHIAKNHAIDSWATKNQELLFLSDKLEGRIGCEGGKAIVESLYKKVNNWIEDSWFQF